MVSLIYGILIFCLLILVIGFFVSSIFNKSDGLSISWASPYECGFCSNSLSLNYFSFSYFSLLVYFVIFDLEISLLLNMPEQGVLFLNFGYYYFFLFILTIGFVGEGIFGLCSLEVLG
uniref:NADH-ubiquinone oxidoreductase chain 3 n=1 Tax=Cloacotaenia megalops TaxID=576527 RepID=A0A1L2FZE5_9CEST|nr:NADH dehydrogenase subunit 3 [Cloacotaenia megalops]AOG66052.1 NADH dehydrogenase subunit 3 [Cloacotaenia megalops]